VQYSVDGLSFKTVGQRNAISGTSEKNYTMLHTNAASIANRLYYRLKMVSTTGAISFSNIVPLRFSATGQLVTDVYPNPTNGIITVATYGLSSAKPIDLKLTDVNGRLIFTKQGVVVNGNITIDLSKFSKGIYTLETIMPDGNRQQFKIIKN
jgi:hypothetical protein